VRTRLALLLVVVSIVMAACDPEELIDFVEGAFTSNFDLSSEPEVRAAGASSTAVDQVREAEVTLGQAIGSKDPEKAREAEQQRPRDPRYPMYTAALARAAGDGEARIQAIRRSMGLLIEQDPSVLDDSDPEFGSIELARRAEELYLEAVADILTSGGGADGQDLLLSEYCLAINGGFAFRYERSAPVEVALFLATEASSAAAQQCSAS
jgi:hypothetical protein